MCIREIFYTYYIQIYICTIRYNLRHNLFLIFTQNDIIIPVGYQRKKIQIDKGNRSTTLYI